MSKKCTPHLFASFQKELTLVHSVSIIEALKLSSKYLDCISDSARLDAELLLAHCLKKTRTYLHTWPEETLTKEQLQNFELVLEKRLGDFPVAYITGKKAFWTFELHVTPAVLIPRPETELLIETALQYLEKIEKPKILDLGTGSGAIALALASERKDASVYASDYSFEALNVAEQNAKSLKINNIQFIHSDWFKNIEEKLFDLIVSNPPYIDPDDPHMLGTIRHEPRSALVADNKGMSDIEIIIKNSAAYLKDKAYLILEHGFDQSDKALKLFENYQFRNRQSLKDLNNNWRISLANYKNT